MYLREAKVYLREHEQKNKKTVEFSSTYLHMSESGRRIFRNLRSNIKYTYKVCGQLLTKAAGDGPGLLQFEKRRLRKGDLQIHRSTHRRKLDSFIKELWTSYCSRIFLALFLTEKDTYFVFKNMSVQYLDSRLHK